MQQFVINITHRIRKLLLLDVNQLQIKKILTPIYNISRLTCESKQKVPDNQNRSRLKSKTEKRGTAFQKPEFKN